MIGQLVASLQKITGVSFASFVYTAKGTGEKAKHLVNIGASTENLYLKDLDILAALLPTLSVGTPAYDACKEIIASRKQSLEKGIGNNDRYSCKDTYTHLAHLPGVRIHNETGELYVVGLSKSKDVLIPGTYKKVNSSDKTLAKKKIQKTLPSSRFRMFALGEITTAKLVGEVLTLTP